MSPSCSYFLFTSIYNRDFTDMQFCSMAGNPSKNLRAEAASIERHIELVQPRRSALKSDTTDSKMEERSKIREKIMVRANNRKAMAMQQIKAQSSSKKGKGEGSRLIPAQGGGMGMALD